jgi:hypothetical protein
MNNIDLSEKFQLYFHESEGFGLRSERFYDSMEAFSNKPALAASMKLWLEAAFIQGARAMARDTVDTLRDYATAVAGIDEVCYNRTQAFDASADYLMTYYTEILQDDKE